MFSFEKKTDFYRHSTNLKLYKKIFECEHNIIIMVIMATTKFQI